MDLHLTDKKALICAASKGMGKAIAKALAAEGVELFLCARGEGPLKAVAEEIKHTTYHPVHWLSCDLSKPESRDALIEKVGETMGRVDILLNNVGGPKASSVESTTPDQWRVGFEQLFLSVAHLSQAFLPQMKAQQWGRILTITSCAVMEPIPNLAISNALRSAVTSMMKTLSNEVASHGVTVNCVAPGIIYTDRIEERILSEIHAHGGTREDHMKNYVEAIPMARMGTPEEFAALVTFLCSQQAGYITGSTLSVDGGRLKAAY